MGSQQKTHKSQQIYWLIDLFKTERIWEPTKNSEKPINSLAFGTLFLAILWSLLQFHHYSWKKLEESSSRRKINTIITVEKCGICFPFESGLKFLKFVPALAQDAQNEILVARLAFGAYFLLAKNAVWGKHFWKTRSTILQKAFVFVLKRIPPARRKSIANRPFLEPAIVLEGSEGFITT